MDSSYMFEYDHDRPASHRDPPTVIARVNGDTSVPHHGHDGVQFEPSRQLITVSEFSTTSIVVFGPTSGTCSGIISNRSWYYSEPGDAVALRWTQEPLKPARCQEIVLSQETASVISASLSHSSLRVKENERLSTAITTLSPAQKTEAESAKSCEVILGAQPEASCTTVASSTHQIHKRKIDTVDPNHYADKENMRLSPSLDRTAPATKHICREKTGTDWQTVLDIVKYGKEQRKKILAVIESKY
ncbi:hypothetical protein F4604DRAFT_1683362 [Suillus subluteus]|nr:hypothetical protein F4604DRAFT_1683362 [Suillus subluteus]